MILFAPSCQNMAENIASSGFLERQDTAAVYSEEIKFICSFVALLCVISFV